MTEKDKLFTVSDWADKNRVLSEEVSGDSGRWDTSKKEYQREIMNAILSPECTDVVVMGGEQAGKTEILLNIMGYYIDYEPSPIMVVQPTVDIAEVFSKIRFDSLVNDTSNLSGKITKGYPYLNKKFPGGNITFSGANSLTSLVSRPVKILLFDEIDRYPIFINGEGDPIELATKKTRTFAERKIVKMSTPTLKNSSRIEASYFKSSMESWNISCPHCGEYQTYDWPRLRFSDAKMKCKHCEEYFSETEWKQQPGKWVAYKMNNASRGFHFNAMISPWIRWDEIIKRYREAWAYYYANNKSMEMFALWTNVMLGMPWDNKAPYHE